MKEFLQNNMEHNKKLKILELVLIACMFIASLICFIVGSVQVNKNPGQVSYIGTVELYRDFDAEDYDEDSTKCDVLFVSEDGEKEMIITYSYEDYEELEIEKIIGYEYLTDSNVSIIFDHMNPTEKEISSSTKAVSASKHTVLFNAATSLLILSISLGVITFFAKQFTAYEKIWFITIMVLATIFAIIFPEESANGVSGIIIMLLYLLDTFLNILCELLISKQSKWNFIVSVGVEITEIVICIVLMYRFATMLTTLLFWLPIDILSFVNWAKHKDKEQEELTAVRRLKGWQEILVIVGIVVWTVVIGYLISGLNISTDFFGGNEALETAIIYIDACASAVGIANGLFIFFRFREQWIAWYICALLEAAINIMTGQFVLLILKVGYLTNTTYGYIKWTKYVNSRKEEKLTLF
ncbi:MAG: nicotinamide riboside transporter PnuC [Bacilli bacterium]